MTIIKIPASKLRTFFQIVQIKDRNDISSDNFDKNISENNHFKYRDSMLLKKT